MARYPSCWTGPLLLSVMAFSSISYAEATNLERCKGYDRSAIDICTAVLADKSLSSEDSSVALAARGQARRRDGDTVGALADLDEALSQDPNNRRALSDWEQLSEGAEPGWALCASHTASSEKRLAACSEIIAKKDASAVRRREALKQRVSIYRWAMGRPDNDRTIADLNAALEISPRDAAALITRGQVRKDQGAFEEAIADFTRAAEVAPRLSQPLEQRGEAYQEQGDIAKARADYEIALKIDKYSVAKYKLEALGAGTGKPKNQPPLGGSSGSPTQTAATSGDVTGDIASVGGGAKSLAACESGQANVAPDARIAACNAALAELTEEAAQKNFVLFLDRARAFAWRGWASYEKGDYDTALTDLNEAIRIDPNFKFMFVFRGNIHMAKKNYNQAIVDLTHAARNNYQPAFSHLAAVYVEQKDYPAAMTQIDEALRRDASDIGALFLREKVHMALGKPADALRDCQAALAIKPEMKGKRACLAEAKAQPTAAAPQEQMPAVSQPQQPPAAVQTSAMPVPAAQSPTTPSPPAKAAPSEPATAAKPSVKNLPKDWITPR